MKFLHSFSNWTFSSRKDESQHHNKVLYESMDQSKCRTRTSTATTKIHRDINTLFGWHRERESETNDKTFDAFHSRSKTNGLFSRSSFVINIIDSFLFVGKGEALNSYPHSTSKSTTIVNKYIMVILFPFSTWLFRNQFVRWHPPLLKVPKKRSPKRVTRFEITT
jgi:hypothetical protein